LKTRGQSVVLTQAEAEGLLALVLQGLVHAEDIQRLQGADDRGGEEGHAAALAVAAGQGADDGAADQAPA